MDNPNVCVLCGMKIEGSRIGAGDGTGQKFAHPECYYRQRAALAEKKVRELSQTIDALNEDRYSLMAKVREIESALDSAKKDPRR